MLLGISHESSRPFRLHRRDDGASADEPETLRELLGTAVCWFATRVTVPRVSRSEAAGRAAELVHLCQLITPGLQSYTQEGSASCEDDQRRLTHTEPVACRLADFARNVGLQEGWGSIKRRGAG